MIPLKTDAPIYHWPWMTVALIVANIGVAAYTGLGFRDGGEIGLQLAFGEGLRPWEWVTSNFVHYDPMHLVGNMIFLWGFGLVVEGKLGWWRYLIIYLSIGAIECAITQTIALGYSGPAGGAAGASAIIYGLLAICVVWAPKNEVTVLVLLPTFRLFAVFIFEISILTFCGLYIAMEAVFLVLTGFELSGILSHVIGAALGAVVGVVMLKNNWVDCENWDLFAVWNNTHGNPKEFDSYRYRDYGNETSWSSSDRDKDASPTADPKSERRRTKAEAPLRRLRRFLDSGNAVAAVGELDKLIASNPSFRLGADDLYLLADGIYREKHWEDARPLLTEYLQRFAATDRTKTLKVRLKLARLLVDHSDRPDLARKALRPIRRDDLSVSQQKAFDQLRARVRDKLEHSAEGGGSLG
ncbi:rhomboid family intramembrane serine protease [Stratiformator vulcanicus]|uniref:Rhomboid family protein n=1 Tax=Stratiformator vulcanicus TaxID=2527980 RepID=A0A517QW02_9PLAN|nr:rhomboid family intramembrane serine protease [Stratiformator vulcanicus]QDT35839.1 Rhomboid family protein [Stratiformator vulcanicus]